MLGDLCEGAEQGHCDAGTVRYAQAAAGVEIPLALRALAVPVPLLAANTVMLRESHRFSGSIGALALAVHAGDGARAAALLRHDDSGALHSLEGVEPQAAVDLALAEGPAPSYRDYLLRLGSRPVADDAPGHAAWATSVLTAFERFRLLCAVREGEWGMAGLNRLVEKALAQTGLLAPRGEWYTGRPIMVTRNDPSLGVFNGDIGIALPSPSPGGGLRAYFVDGTLVRSVGVSRLAHVETAFAMTVHKSQGSEFEHTVLVLPSYGGSVLSRELVYTGITRARQAFTLFAERPGLLATAIQQPTKRASGLLGFLNVGAS